MKFVSLLFSFIILCAALTAASPPSISSNATIPVLVAEATDHVPLIFTITNNGIDDNFTLYALAGATLVPEDSFFLGAGQSITLEREAKVSASVQSHTRGYFLFRYELSSPQNGLTKGEQVLKIVSLQNLFQVSARAFAPGNEDVVFTLTNAEDVAFNNVQVQFKSDFFDASKVVSLPARSSLNITVPLRTGVLKQTKAGTYDSFVTLVWNDAETTVRVPLTYLEKSGLVSTETSQGVIVHSTTVEKRNEGSIPVQAEITSKRDILTRLLTYQTPSADEVTKRGFFVTYTWKKELSPGEALSVTTTTNYTLPLIVLILIIIGVVGVRLYLLTPLTITKRVNHVRTKGGQFALKVTVHIKARKPLSNVTLVDHIPHSMKLYSQFGTKPEEVNENTRMLSWKLSHLNAGETRIFSYIIYSPLRVFGSFALPAASASYTSNGKQMHTSSNRTAFAEEATSSE